MRILFWNIGDTLTSRKQHLLQVAIDKERPDIFCIAEGTSRMDDCNTLIELFARANYWCYYSPLFSQKTELNLDYRAYDPFGLKVFISNELKLKEQFEFSLQRMGGRIILVKTYLDFIPITLILVHIISKKGSRNSTQEQHYYIGKLRDIIDNETGKITDNNVDPENLGIKERILIFGDFNIEPWETVLNDKLYLMTNFFKKRDKIKRRGEAENIFFNPAVELILSNGHENLAGTYYTERNGWAVFDYLLYNTISGDVNYRIISEFDAQHVLLNPDITIKKSFLNDGIDHLPVIAEIIN